MEETTSTLHRWQGSELASESAIRRQFEAEGLRPYAWSNLPGDAYAAHSHAYHKVIFVVRGAITIGLPDEGRKIHIKAGDRLDLPAHTVHDAVVGRQSVACLEAHRA